jgi:methyl-accepting chemotaxis protein
VTQVSHATTSMVENIGSLAQGNQKLYQQSARQAKELEEVTAHIASLETHVEGNTGYAKLASSRADEAREAAAGGDQMMSTVNASMQAIVERSSEMRGIVAMIDSVAFQTNILALNAPLRRPMRVTRARVCRGGPRSRIAGPKEQPFDADHSGADQPLLAGH